MGLSKRLSFTKTELRRAVEVAQELGLIVHGIQVEGGGFTVATQPVKEPEMDEAEAWFSKRHG